MSDLRNRMATLLGESDQFTTVPLARAALSKLLNSGLLTKALDAAEEDLMNLETPEMVGHAEREIRALKALIKARLK
jgi:hypothetical protein